MTYKMLLFFLLKKKLMGWSTSKMASNDSHLLIPTPCVVLFHIEWGCFVEHIGHC